MLAVRTPLDREKVRVAGGVQKQNCKSLHFASVRMSGLEVKSGDLHPIRWRYQATTVLSICSPYLTGRRKSMLLAFARIPHRYRHVAQSEPVMHCLDQELRVEHEVRQDAG